MAHSSLLPSFAQHLRIERGLSDRTVDGYGRDLFLFFKWAGSDADVTKDLIQGYLADRPAWSAPSRARAIAAIKTFCKWMVDHGHIDADPSARISTPKLPKKLPRFPSVAVADALLAKFDDPRDRALMSVFRYAGLRRREVYLLNVDSIEGSELRVENGKGAKERMVPLHPECRAALKAWLAVRPETSVEPALFVTPAGARLSYSMIGKIVGENSILATGARYSCHKFRHAAATEMHSAGVDLIEIKEILGHASVTSTQIYTHTSKDRLREAVEKIGGRR